MKSTPQNVTERYVSNLLHNGQNRDFRIIELRIQETVHDQVSVGYFYTIMTRATDWMTESKSASAATPAQALRRALEKHGVTFR